MTNNYEVVATVSGTSVNEVTSKLLAAAYYMDFEVTELEVALSRKPETVLFWEDAVEQLTEVTNPEDNDPQAPFRFPLVRELVEDLQKKKAEDDRRVG